MVRRAPSLDRSTCRGAACGSSRRRVTSDCVHETGDCALLQVLLGRKNILSRQVDLILLLAFSCHIDFDHLHVCNLGLLFLYLLVRIGLIYFCVLLHVLVTDVYQILVEHPLLHEIVVLAICLLHRRHFHLVYGHFETSECLP